MKTFDPKGAVSYHSGYNLDSGANDLKAEPSGQIRIIGGKWRSRKLRFPATTALRPSPDSVRETLFNWLQSDIAGSRCLDLYAGSGALGFEAASRQAESVTLVESNSRIVRQLQSNVALLGAGDTIAVEQHSCPSYLATQNRPFDIIFADPPFDAQQLVIACQSIAASAAICNQTLLYLESARSREPLPIPASWHIIRQKARGRVQSTLIQTTSQ